MTQCRDVIDVPVWTAVLVIIAVSVVAPNQHVGIGDLCPSTDNASPLYNIIIIVVSQLLTMKQSNDRVLL